MRSIRLRLSLLATALALLAAGFAGTAAVADFRRAAEAARTAQVAEATQALLSAAGAFAVERGTGNGLVASPATATPARRAALQEARRHGDAELARGLAALRMLGLGGDALATLAERRARVEILRGQLDALLAAGGAAQPPAALAADWFPAMSALILSAAEDLMVAARGAIAGGGNPAAVRGFDLARALWEAGEFAGRERGMANGIVAADRAMSAAELRQLGEVRGRVVSAWGSVGLLADALGPALRADVLAARAAYFAPGFTAQRDAMFAAGDPLTPAAAGPRYPLTAEAWFRAATEAMAPTLAAQQASATALRAGAEQARRTKLLDAALSVALLAATLGLGGLAVWFAVRRVGQPLSDIAAAMQRLAAGDRMAEARGAERPDEIGGLVRAFASFRGAAEEQARMAAAALAEAQAREARAIRIEALVRDFEAETAEALRGLASASTELDATAGELAGNAERGRERAGALAAATEEASANVGTVAASAEELAASIGEVARQVAESAATARRAAQDASATDAAMSGLSEAAGRIGDVVRLIGDIAGQTNLLALNATIEAARAGDSGKGFAVVASEVKALAAQTARATEEIGAQIAAMQAETRQAVAAIEGIGGTIAAMDQLAASVAASAEQQAAATQEITRAVSEAASGTQEVTRHAAAVGGDATSTGAAAAQLRGASSDIARESETLRARVDGFLAGLRAA
jgi:methyl-accepting chemotaxis protein